MVRPSQLKEIDDSGYHNEIIYRDVLEKLDVPGVQEEHETMENAVNEIHLKKNDLGGLSLTILPMFYVTWDGTEVY